MWWRYGKTELRSRTLGKHDEIHGIYTTTNLTLQFTPYITGHVISTPHPLLLFRDKFMKNETTHLSRRRKKRNEKRKKRGNEKKEKNKNIKNRWLYRRSNRSTTIFYTTTNAPSNTPAIAASENPALPDTASPENTGAPEAVPFVPVPVPVPVPVGLVPVRVPVAVT